MNQVSNFPYLKKKLSFGYFILWVWLMSTLNIVLKIKMVRLVHWELDTKLI